MEEDDAWYVVNEGSDSVFNNGTYYLMIKDGKLEIVHRIR